MGQVLALLGIFGFTVISLGLIWAFFGRRAIAGLDVGRRIRVEGRVVRNIGRECLLNPVYEFVEVPGAPSHASS
jgi:hypothetical protein